MVRVAVIQLGLPLREDDAAVPDTSIVAESIEQATQAGAEVVVLPELWRTGPFELESTLDLARDLDADEITILGRIAATLGIWLCAGSVLEKPQGDAAVYNTLRPPIANDTSSDSTVVKPPYSRPETMSWWWTHR